MIIIQKKYQPSLIILAISIPILCLFFLLNHKTILQNQQTINNNPIYSIKKTILQNKLKVLKINVLPKKIYRKTILEPIQFLVTGNFSSLTNLLINILNNEKAVVPAEFDIHKTNNKLFLQLNLLIKKQKGQ
ncbi:MAG: hypothetical protein JXR42_02125 [Gammaproteobacteria bacterium]|nr:hypothetical protein [Gammaproteobacteria bacterium]